MVLNQITESRGVMRIEVEMQHSGRSHVPKRQNLEPHTKAATCQGCWSCWELKEAGRTLP